MSRAESIIKYKMAIEQHLATMKADIKVVEFMLKKLIRLLEEKD